MFPVTTRTQERVSPEQLFRYQKVADDRDRSPQNVIIFLPILVDTESRKKGAYT